MSGLAVADYLLDFGRYTVPKQAVYDGENGMLSL